MLDDPVFLKLIDFLSVLSSVDNLYVYEIIAKVENVDHLDSATMNRCDRRFIVQGHAKHCLQMVCNAQQVRRIQSKRKA